MPKTENERISEKYRAHTHESHILELPDTQIGSAESDTVETLIQDGTKIIQKTITTVPGLEKIFDEVFVNALDQYTRLSTMKPTPTHPLKKIDVSIDQETGRITVMNDGMGIDIVEHPEKKVQIPEMIFGMLLTSTNYNKNEEKMTGGKNGQGAKLTNIFSSEFTVETCDSERQLRYKQVWKNNMKDRKSPTIKPYTGSPITKISFIPDFKRFGINSLTDDIVSVLQRRTIDGSVWCGNKVRITWNKKPIACKTIVGYTQLLRPEEFTTKIIQLRSNTPHWEIVVGESDGFRQVSFVNGIQTSSGGRHVDFVVKQITDGLAEVLKKKHKLIVRPVTIKDCLMVVVRAGIVNPSFKSQTKDTLTTPVSKFGTKWELDAKDIPKLLNDTGILDRIIASQNAKDLKDLKKTDGKKKSRITGIPKLEDATLAGTKESEHCTLILTEGDSAATTAISGLKVVGRENFGVFPLKGKLLNVKEKLASKINENTEIQSIKKILGLQDGKKQTDLSTLRYGKVMIMTDQDHDGSHIKGLVLNLFHAKWPELLKMGLIVSILTPIVKVSKGKEIIPFQTLTDQNNWKENEDNLKKWKVKYYKGLGTSDAKESREQFKNMHLLQQNWTDDRSGKAMDLAFRKGNGFEDARKYWLGDYNPSTILDYSLTGDTNSKTEILIEDFISKDLIHFSNASNRRAIPNIMDGLKVSQRKILYSCLKRNLVNEIRVAQLSGYVSEHAAYHHGEMSLNNTIVSLAQNFVGSNNINLLKPIGQFGSRLMGGKDASSPRQIHTELSKITKTIFHPMDSPILNQTDDDGIPVEPEFYAPVIPMILVNGCNGIGTGQSTSIPPFNPKVIIENIRKWLENPSTELNVGNPYYNGFTGTILKEEDNSQTTQGKYKVTGDDEIEITELPPGVWTKEYRADLEEFLVDVAQKPSKKLLKDIVDDYNDVDVKITLKFVKGMLEKIKKSSKGVYGTIKLTSKISISNMHLQDRDDKLRKFDSPEEILKHQCEHRLNLYNKRKEYLLQSKKNNLETLSAKAKFILAVLDETIVLRRISDEELLEKMITMEFPKKETKEGDELSSWDYLLKMPLRSLTKNLVEKILKEKEKCERELEMLEKTSIKQFWLNDLEVFEKSQDEFLDEKQKFVEDIRDESSNVNTKGTKSKSKNKKVYTKK